MLSNRYTSLDIFRGATVAFMILVNNPGSWSNTFAPLKHAGWHGCTPTDLVFPFFLFAVGNALAFVFDKFKSNNSRYFWSKIIKRSLLIFLIGLLLNWSPFIKWDGNNLVYKQFQDLRILGVLQRIAICYFFAAILIYYCTKKWLIISSILILFFYWIIAFFLGDSVNPYSLQGFIGNNIDRYILGNTHLYKGEGVPFDPEGIFSTIPAIVQVIIGFLVGNFIKNNAKNFETLTTLFLYGISLVFIGFCWNYSFPINKKIWTSSYVLYTAGLAIVCLTFLIYWIEFKNVPGKWRNWFLVFGKNALFIFVLSGFLPRVLALIRWQVGFNLDTNKPLYETPLHWFYEHICINITPNLNIASLLYAVTLIFFYWLIVYWLDKKKIYIKV